MLLETKRNARGKKYLMHFAVFAMLLAVILSALLSHSIQHRRYFTLIIKYALTVYSRQYSN